ncbi:uncharacterized protein YALI1_F18641g [Yarrowia lipolytica]|uniref:Uncharacterized protein n=1 Tax=Yarrowia lipolytica TaxID=4952 RepID=A0A1D8NNF6_YARLL|nr:hypothetical protein YALI1_F18641g [Yarrowia lipolytica]
MASSRLTWQLSVTTGTPSVLSSCSQPPHFSAPLVATPEDMMAHVQDPGYCLVYLCAFNFASCHLHNNFKPVTFSSPFHSNLGYGCLLVLQSRLFHLIQRLFLLLNLMFFRPSSDL